MAKRKQPKLFSVVELIARSAQFGIKRADRLLADESANPVVDLHFICGCVRRMRAILTRVGFTATKH